MSSKAPKASTPFRQLDERTVPFEVSHLCWNPTMDLVAVAGVDGSLILYRLSWQRVWQRPPRPYPSGATGHQVITSLAWRPDGRVLAVGHASGLLILYEVEGADLIHSIEIAGEVSWLSWTARCDTLGSDPESSADFYTDVSARYLPRLPVLSKTSSAYSRSPEEDEDFESIEDKKRLKSQTKLNILVIGTSLSKVHLYAFGIFPAGELFLKSPFPGLSDTKSKICSAMLSEDFGLLTIVAEVSHPSKPLSYFISSYEIPLLQWKYREIMVIAKKYGQISSLLSYLATTIKAISEAWEDVLLEIDSKLTNYAQEKAKSPSSGTVSDDFLELLMFGTLSDPLERFLLNDLTEKGLKKLGHSIELSYSNIQKLVLKHLQNVAQCLFYHMNDLKGMAGWQVRFEALELSEKAAHDATLSIASFLMKAVEIQQVIDTSMKNFKSFFRWLYTVILRLTDEPVPLEIIKVSQQDLDFVAEFLKDSFSAEWNDKNPSTFSLEKVGQYLKNENLTLPPDVLKNPWVMFLEKNPHLKESKLLFPHYPEKSLIQQHLELKEAVKKAFRGPNNRALKNEKGFLKRQEHLLFTSSDPLKELKLSHASAHHAGYIYTAFTSEPPPCNHLFIIRESLLKQHVPSLHAVIVKFGEINDGTVELSSPEERCESHNVLDLQFYNEETLSILLAENRVSETPVLLQLPLKEVCQNLHTVLPSVNQAALTKANLAEVDAALLSGSSARCLESMHAVGFAVSGTRKVACVLFSNRTRVRLFEMDAEDDDDDAPDEEENEASILDDMLKEKDASFLD